MNKLKMLALLILFVLGAASVNAQDSGSNVAITLERTACFGSCPVYTVSILEDGTVLYNGENFVDVTGEQTTQIPPETVQLMVEAFEKAGYFDWNEVYDNQTVSDLPTIITSVTRDGETHSISRYVGDSSAPLALPFLEQWIDLMSNAGMWTGSQADISTISDGTNTPLATLERTACFGPCPVYSVALFEDGTMVYTGIANVDNIGVYTFEADPLAVESIAQRADIFGYFDWQDAYDTQVMTDQETVITSVRWEDQSKRIVRYGGDPNAPVGLMWIESYIDQLVTELVV
jgi:hypothetical protein